MTEVNTEGRSYLDSFGNVVKRLMAPIDKIVADFKLSADYAYAFKGLLPTPQDTLRLFLTLGHYEVQRGKNWKHKGSDVGYCGFNAWWDRRRMKSATTVDMALEYILPNMMEFSTKAFFIHYSKSYCAHMFMEYDQDGIAAAKTALGNEVLKFSLCYAAWLETLLVLKHDVFKTEKRKTKAEFLDNFINWWQSGDITKDAKPVKRSLLSKAECDKILALVYLPTKEPAKDEVKSLSKYLDLNEGDDDDRNYV